MAFVFNDFMADVRLDNPKYERMYRKTRLSKSRLHGLVAMLQRDPFPSPETIANAMLRVPAAAWTTRYRRAKAYLIREVPIAGLEVPPGQPAVQGMNVYHAPGRPIHGYGPGPLRAATTGRGGRLDGRFYWTIEVVYTLAAGVDPQRYAPFRQAKDAQGYRDKPRGAPWQLPPSSDQLLANASVQPWAPDGPRHYNVKRAAHTISVCDGPGIDAPGAAWVTRVPNHYPFRQSVYFKMSLYRVKPGKHLTNDFDAADLRSSIGMELPGSQVAFHYKMWRDAMGTPPGGVFTRD